LSGVSEGLRSVCELTRPVTSSIPALLTGVVAAAGVGISPGAVVRGGLAMGLTAMTGFAVDNIYDLPADRVAGQPTPLTDGRLSLLQARVITAILALFAIVLSPHGIASRVTIATTVLALWCYSSAARWAPWFKNFYSASLVCVPLFFGSLIGGIRVPSAYYLVLALFMLGRESLIDVQQAETDRKIGFRTVALLLGRSVTQISGTTMIVLAGGLLVFCASGPAARLASALCLGTLVAVLGASLPPIRRTGWLRIPMAIGVVAIGLSLSFR
jgi:4-hydroxybenzoate polyprenyltransferase